MKQTARAIRPKFHELKLQTRHQLLCPEIQKKLRIRAGKNFPQVIGDVPLRLALLHAVVFGFGRRVKEERVEIDRRNIFPVGQLDLLLGDRFAPGFVAFQNMADSIEGGRAW